MSQAVFARILQSADKFCRIFPCKMSEFSMFYNLFGCMHACILHVLSVGLTRDKTIITSGETRLVVVVQLVLSVVVMVGKKFIAISCVYKHLVIFISASAWCLGFLDKKFLGFLTFLAKILAIILGKVRKILQDFSRLWKGILGNCSSYWQQEQE